MKRYIRAATTYKGTDPRLPLIKALEDVVEIPFEGSSTYSGPTSYSNKYECYVGYKIVSGKNVGTNRYRLSVECLNRSEPYPYVPIPDDEQDMLYEKEEKIVMDITRYIHKNYPELDAEPNLKFKFITCDSYYGDNPVEDDSEKMYSDVINLLSQSNMEYKERFRKASYRSSPEYLNIRIPGADPYSPEGQEEKDSILELLKENGFNVKSIITTKGTDPGYWMDYIIRIYYK